MEIVYIQKNILDKEFRFSKEASTYSLLNAFCLFEKKDWEDGYKSHYIDTLHQTCCQPTDPSINTRMLRLASFHGSKKETDFEQAIVTFGKYYYYAKKANNRIYIYGIQNRLLNKSLDGAKIYVKKDHIRNVNPRKNERKMNAKSLSVSLYNENPNGNLVGDCAIRAVATVTGLGWHGAVDGLGNTAIKKKRIFINCVAVIEGYLLEMGFTGFPAPTNNKSAIRVADFCVLAGSRFNQKPIFIYSGPGHVVTLVWKDDKYLIQDTWDSSRQVAGKYFVKINPKEKPKTTKQIPSLKRNDVIIHPFFGRGTINGIKGDTVSVQFSSLVIKSFKKSWVLEHCRKE